MKTCSLAQAGFVTRLVDEYLDDIFNILALAKLLVEASLHKLSEVRVRYLRLYEELDDLGRYRQHPPTRL